MARAKDYTNKIQFWTEQVALAANPRTAHKAMRTLYRCQQTLDWFKHKQRALAEDLLELPNMTEEQHDRLAVASVAVSNLITEFSESDPRWNAIWEEFDLLEAVEDHIKKLQS